MEERIYRYYDVRELLRIQRIYSIFKRHYPGGYTFAGESHDFWECVYVLEGEACVSGDGRVHDLRRGDMVFHKPMEWHKFRIEAGGADLFIFSFSLEGPAARFFRDKVFTLDAAQRETVASLGRYIDTHTREETLPEAPDGFNRYTPLLKEEGIHSQMMATYIVQILLLLYADGQPGVSSRTADAELFGRAVEQMRENISEGLAVEEIAVRCNASVSGLKRAFLKYAGTGVHAYYLTMRMEAATRLLKKGVPVGETAERLGFATQGYFSAAYKRETGRSPTEVLRRK